MSVKRVMIDELTGLRGIAALFIILNHIQLLYHSFFNYNFAFKHYFICCGIIGMDLFFILSGFVIYYNYADKIRESAKDGILKFLIARFARLYPLYFVFIIGFFIYNLITGYHNTNMVNANFATLPAFLLGVQSWIYAFLYNIPVVHLQGSANISWSISTEFGLYLFFIPFVIYMFKKRTIKSSLALFIFSITAYAALAIFLYKCNIINPLLTNLFGFSKSITPQNWVINMFPLGGRMFQFMSGCAIAQFYICAKDKFNKNIYKVLSYFSSIAIFLCMMNSGWMSTIANENISHTTAYMFSFIVFSLLCSVFVFSITLGGAAFLRVKQIVWLGEISYSSYLLHIIFILIFKNNGHHISSYLLNICAFILFTYIIAWLSYKYFEMPMRKKTKYFLYNLFNIDTNGKIGREKEYEKTCS